MLDDFFKKYWYNDVTKLKKIKLKKKQKITWINPG